MKIQRFSLILIFLTNYSSANNDITAISQAISETINKFHPNYERKLQIVILGLPTNHLKDIINEVCKRLVNIPIVMKNFRIQRDQFEFSTLILVKKFRLLNLFNAMLQQIPLQSRKYFKIYFYCEDLTVDGLEYVQRIEKLTYDAGYFSEFEYFFINDRVNDLVHVKTFVWFGSEFCNEAKTKSVGKFDKKRMNWREELSLGSKFENFYGCELVFGYLDQFLVLQYAKMSDENLLEPKGVYQDIFEIAAVKYNFKIGYQVIKSNISDILSNEFVNTCNSNVRKPNVIFYPLAIVNTGESYQIVTSPFYESKIVFMISPGTSYSSFEKLAMPFDFDTWKLVYLTFGAAFCVIFVINLTPQWVKDLIYGYRVNTPSLNVLGTFFGISQTRLPTGNFARIILISFVLFCLVMRTAYQGVQYDMMTQDMRRPPIEKISDIWEQNYDVYYSKNLKHVVESIDGWENFNLKPLSSYEEMDEIYTKQKSNESAKSAMLIFYTQILVKSLDNENIWPMLKEDIYTVLIGIGFAFNNFFYHPTNELIQLLLPSGIPQHSFQFHFDYVYKKKDPEITVPQILKINDLFHGFIIWLVACGVATIVFIFEIIYSRIIKKIQNLKMKKFKFAKIHPKNDFKDQKSWPNAKTLRAFYLIKDIRVKFAKIHPMSDESDEKLNKLNDKMTENIVKVFRIKKVIIKNEIKMENFVNFYNFSAAQDIDDELILDLIDFNY